MIVVYNIWHFCYYKYLWDYILLTNTYNEDTAMSVRLWPQNFETRDHLTASEKGVMRYAQRCFTDGHVAVDIDPCGLSSQQTRIGMYISPKEGLITFSLMPTPLETKLFDAYKMAIDNIEKIIYNRLIDSMALIVKKDGHKRLKFPYKHVFMFQTGKNTRSLSAADRSKMNPYIMLFYFQPLLTANTVLRGGSSPIFNSFRQPYDDNFTKIGDLECRAIFERLAPEYTVVMGEKENIKVEDRKSVSMHDMKITGKESEYKTFFLDEYQVAQVNDLGRGHRVVLANPGAGKSVILLSKAFKYASMYKDSRVLLTCYNSNLADAYDFKRKCANFGKNNNLFIMNIHRLVNHIDLEYRKINRSGYPDDDEIRDCLRYIESGKCKLKFLAIFIDEIQNFDPMYLDLCHALLDESEEATFLMAGDLNQKIRKMSKKGDAPWKRMNETLDYTGRVKYIEKNYRNSAKISLYICDMLTRMNHKLTSLGLINSLEYEYNSFQRGTRPTVALEIRRGLNRMDIQKEILAAVDELAKKHNISYSDIAILFPYRQYPQFKYNTLYWIESGLRKKNIPYSLIISGDEYGSKKTKYSLTTGVVVSTIESSLGLDFKAVILAGLYPYGYIYRENSPMMKLGSWDDIKKLKPSEQETVQTQMRALYTACSRARDALYVLSDIEKGTVMDDLIDS